MKGSLQKNFSPYFRVEWGVARLMGVAVAKAKLNKTVHLYSKKGCTINFILKPIYPALLSACVVSACVRTLYRVYTHCTHGKLLQC